LIALKWIPSVIKGLFLNYSRWLIYHDAVVWNIVGNSSVRSDPAIVTYCGISDYRCPGSDVTRIANVGSTLAFAVREGVRSNDYVGKDDAVLANRSSTADINTIEPMGEDRF